MTKRLGILVCVGLFGLVSAQVVFDGPPCKGDTECPANSKCVTSNCQCSTGYVLSGDWTKCLEVPLVPYSTTAKCEENIQCVKRMNRGAICDNGMCVCKDGYHYLHGLCYESKGLGSTCNVDDDCYDGYSFETVKCGTAKKCECADGYYAVDGGLYSACRKKGTNLNDECMTDLDCDESQSLYCNTAISQCVDSDTRPAVTETIKWPTFETDIKPGTPCKYSTDCSPSTKLECFNQKCVCKPGYSEHNSYCMKDIGESCTTGSDCAKTDHIECGADLTCRCKYPYARYSDNAQCRIIRLYNQQCQYKEQCFYLGSGAECAKSGIRSKCLCKTGYHYADDLKLCIPDKGIEDSCNHDRDCAVASSTCQSPECKCISNYHENSGKCVPDVNYLGDYCLTSDDCITTAGILNSECVNNKCLCAVGYYQNSTRDACLTGVKGVCTNDSDCAVNDAQCQENKCVCKAGNIPSDSFDKCLPVGSKGSGCVADVQCTGELGNGGACVNGKCECKHGYHYNEKSCWDTKYLGDVCERESQCYLKSGSYDRVKCRNGYCKCDFQYEQTEDLDCRSGVGRDSASAAVTGLFLLIALFNMRDGWTAGRP